jgi:phthiocerol/phenolphthiocerol synthesis type-I polyketide synthase C
MPNKKQRIAIVGMAFRFPGDIDNQEKFWDALTNRQDLVTEVGPDRWDSSILKHSRKSEAGKSYVFSAGQLNRIREFDAQFFGISPREAGQMDPQQRLLLELSWEAMEDAAVNPETLEGSDTAVYVGIASTDYAHRRMDDLSSADAYSMTGSTASIASNRISYIFDLHGPSMSIDTACSSSLVALHQACNSIWKGEASKALVGGVNLLLHPFGFVGFSKASMLSPTGRCRAFDAGGNGYVRSEGCAVLYLKPLEQAEKDGDRIHAVIVNTGVNSDGRTNGITMPSFDGQCALLKKVYEDAGINVNEIDYIEAHGTGTAVGDPIEATAIGETLAKLRSHKHFLPIGSVKTNVGHMETASGMAGIVKTILCLKHRAIPPNLHFDTPNPNIDFDGLNISVVDQMSEFPESDKNLIAGVNSFGFGGANSHAILEEYKDSRERNTDIPEDIDAPPLFLSAATPAALKQMAEQYADFLRTNSAWYYDIAYQLAYKRAHLNNGLAVKAKSVSGLIRALRSYIEGAENSPVVTQPLVEKKTDLAFIYSGNGSQWLGMGRELLAADEFFAEKLREVDGLLGEHVEYSIIEELHAEPENSRFHLTEIAQPTLFAVQVGITEWLADQGIKPKAVAGHSVGEVTAAWAAGALSLKQATHLIVERSAAQGLTRGTGRMSAMGLGREDAISLIDELGLNDQVEIAGVNSTKSVTLAGSLPALQKLESVAEQRDVFCRILDLDYAFHSKYMDPVKDRLLTSLESLRPGQTSVPMYSTVTGEKIDGKKFTAQYWWENVRRPVAFGKAVDAMIEDGIHVFMDVGPHPIMRGYLNECLRNANVRGLVSPTLMRKSDEVQDIQRALLSVHLAGAYMDLDRHFPVSGTHIDLPTYPWQHQEYWHEVTDEGYNLTGRRIEHPLLGYRIKPELPQWEIHLDCETVPYLADHVVGNGEVMPAAAYVEMALAAAKIWYQEEGYHELEDLEIRSPLLFEADQLRTLRFELSESSGHFVIKSRLRLTDDAWTEHVVGRVLHHSSEPKESAHAIELSKNPEGNILTGDQHYQIAAKLGLKYGPCFQGIKQVWISGNSAVASVITPEGISDRFEQHVLHPCYLDSCFQVLVGLISNQFSGNRASAMIPVRVGRLRTYSTGKIEWFSAQITRQSPRSVLANFQLFDAEGKLVARAEDCRFRAVNFVQDAQETGIYEYLLQPKPNAFSISNSATLDTKSLAKAAENILNSESQLKRRQTLYSEVVPLLDTLIACYVYEALNHFAENQELSLDSLFSDRGVEPRHQYLVSRLLQIMEEQGWAEKQDKDSWKLAPNEEIPDSQSVWLTLIGDYPGLMPEVLLAGRAGSNLSDILSGKRKAEDFIKPGKSSGLKDHLADTALSIKGTMDSLVDVITQWTDQKEQYFRVLHLGNGQGKLSQRIIKMLPINSDYHYLHADTEICGKVEALIEDYPQAQVSQIDFESADEWEEFTDQQAPFDLVIVNETLHAHTHPDRLLQTLRSVMSAESLLLCMEKNPSRLADITFGLDDDYWHRTTNPENPTPLRLHVNKWASLTQSAGFTDTQTISDDPDKISGSYLLLARNEAAPEVLVAEKRWLIVTDSTTDASSLTHKLAEQLPEHIHATYLSHQAGCNKLETPDEGQNILDLVNGSFSENLDKLQLSQIDSVLFLCGLNTRQSELGDSLNLRTVAALNIAKLLNTLSENSPSLRLVTLRGSTASIGEKHLADAALWGLGRVIRNEIADIDCSQIDLASDKPDSLIPALITELEHPNNDREIVLEKNLRYALEMQPRPIEKGQEEDWNGPIKLDFSDPGLLKNLQWVPLEYQSPGTDELKIRPMASGLNFRDVMYAMGLLSDEAVESGFSGPTLGMEFAGEVEAVGKDVSGFSVGDRVMGFGPACFSTQLITKATAVAQIPQTWLFEEAATIPTTFFTAYYALDHLARLQEGERILIHGGAGGVGIAAIQLAHHLGAEVFVTAGSDEKRDFVRLMGADHILDSRSLNFADDIMELTNGEGIDVVLNSLAGEAINKNLKILRPFGRFLELGKRDFYENSRIGLRPFRNNISYFGIDADQLMVEKPKLAERVFKELMLIFEEGALRPLPYRVFNATRAEEAFRYMQQARQIGKILLNYEDLPKVKCPVKEQRASLQLDPEATYLVTGGLGGFGLETAKFLASKGAKHLTLISRSGTSPESSIESFNELAKMDVELSCHAIDVTSQEQLSALFDNFGSSLPALKGIVHAATVFDDALLQNLDATRMRKVLDPKVIGGWHLHELSKSHELDMFVVYSSVTTYFGNPGQGNYVAANSALEGLAELRKSQGLKGLFVAWGAINDAGFLARNEDVKDALQARLGGSSLTSKHALSILEDLLLSDRTGCAVMDINWGAMKRFLPISSSNQYRILNWQAARQGGDDDQGEDIRELLKGLDHEEALAKVAELLSREIGHILRIPADKLDQQTSVFDLGMDSLMGVELAIAVEKRFTVNMPAMALSEGPSILRLSERIIQKLMGAEAEQEDTQDTDNDSVRRLANVHNENLGNEGLEELSNKMKSSDKNSSIL